MISEEELETAMGRIEQCLDDFDKVGGYAVQICLGWLNGFSTAGRDPGRSREREGLQGYARQLIACALRTC